MFINMLNKGFIIQPYFGFLGSNLSGFNLAQFGD